MHEAISVLALVGDTPLVDLTPLAGDDAEPGTVVLGKFEATNPGGSIKDRIAKAMVERAELEGLLDEGGTIVEPTSGNTGIGLAMVAAERGYRMILTMPETMSVERRKLAQMYGAEIVLTPGSEGMKGAIAKAAEIVDETPGAWMPGQFDNPANPRAHYETTGPEIWRDTEETVDVLVAGVGTGGTISGASRFLKEKNPELIAIAVEPAESPVLEGGAPGPHKIQGIGAGFVPKNYDADMVDEVRPVSSEDAIAMRARLASELGILVGISAGAAVKAAVDAACEPEFMEKTIVAILPDTGERYLSMS